MTLDNLTKILQKPWAWIPAIVLVLLLWEGGKKWLPALVEWLAKQVRAALAGTRVMHGRALRAYREQVASRYARLPVMLLEPGNDIDASTVYVPLQAVGDRGGTPAEAYDQIKATDHAIVLGRPGAGKTMLLRHSMLTWARDPSWRRDQRVPVLLELIRYGGRDKSWEELIVEQFAEDGFKKADRFTDRALHDGKLSVLFDGLDEVSAAQRDNVVQSLRSFAAKYRECQIVVTCRTAIYQQQLAPEITTSFEVAEFDDHHIRRFLRQWPDIPDDTGVERLLSALRDAPRIMQLARNPLLLTMIAHLYGGRSTAETVLPHSRAEFYNEAVNALLGRLKDSQNKFKGAVKRAVLVRLAAAIQNTAATSADRRTRRYEDVLSDILSIRERLNIAASDVEALLDEIVERSGLLLRIDGGTRFQFAHLSLQEYLAAVAFEQDADGLLARYRAAPGDWREVLKLWCGVVSTGSAPLIESVFGIDELLAFECLADGQVVDATTADRIIEHFQQDRLTSAPEVVNAFGLVAGDPRPRGRRVFEYLVETARTGNALAHAPLAATKLPEAADILVDHIKSSSAQEALIRMGDLAVSALTHAATASSTTVIDVLGGIGTPAAALALTRFITYSREFGGGRAAWHLAALIEDPEIEAALHEAELPEPPRGYWWIWETFSSRPSEQISRVAVWLAHRCSSPVSDFPAAIHRIDPRLAIPLLTFDPYIDIEKVADRISSAGLNEKVGHLRERSYWPARPTESSEAIAEIDAVIDGELAANGTYYSRLYRFLDEKLRVGLVARWIGARRHGTRKPIPVRRQDWRHVSSSITTYDYRTSPEFWISWVTYGLFGLAAMVGTVALLVTDWPWGPTWLGWVLGIIAFIWFLFVLIDTPRDEADPLLVLFAGYGLLRFMADFSSWFDDLEDFLLGCGFVVGSGLTTAILLLVGAHYLGWPASLALTALVPAFVGGLIWYGSRRGRAARNLFVGLLDLDETARRRTSVIAG